MKRTACMLRQKKKKKSKKTTRKDVFLHTYV